VRLRHDAPVVRATFDDANLVSCAGLVPVMRLAQQAGLHDAVAQRVSLPTDKGANPAGKVATIVAGMLAGADSIDDLDIARHGGMRSLFGGVYAPSTLGSFLRTFTHGHVRQLQAAARDTLIGLARRVCQSPGIVEGVVMRPGPPGRGSLIVGSRWVSASRRRSAGDGGCRSR
jgi:hypothetical protein